MEILQSLTNTELAKLNNCSISTIKRYKKKHGISKEHLKYQKYLELKGSGKTNVELSKLVGCSVATISNYHVKSGTTSEFSYNYPPMTRYEKTILIGTLLGDSWLTKSSNTSYRGGFTHKLPNLDYVKYKKDLLSRHCNSLTYKKVEIGYDQATVRLRSSPNMKELYEELYVDGKKKITKSILNYFTDLSLALYYQDDGTKLNSKSKYYNYSIAMYDYDVESLETFQNFLYKKWSLETTFSCGHLRIRARSKKKFHALIKPYIVPSMQYKL